MLHAINRLFVRGLDTRCAQMPLLVNSLKTPDSLGNTRAWRAALSAVLHHPYVPASHALDGAIVVI